jgi:hypothetical protein
MNRDQLLEQALAALPPLSEERQRILQPLTDEKLFVCFQEVRADLVDHIRAKHSRRTNRPGSHAVGAFESFMEEQTEDEFRDVFLQFVSRAVSDYWAHMTEGHAAPAASSAEDYLRLLVERIRRDRSWWVKRGDRRVVLTRGAPKDPA